MSIKNSIQVHGAAVERLESLYEQHEGEVTPDVEAAEAEAQRATDDLLEEHARYQLWIADQREAITKEANRLRDLALAYTRRQEWSDAQIRDLLGGRRKVTVGTRAISTRITHAAVVTAAVEDLPAEFRRPVPGKPAVPPSEAVDAKAIKDHMIEKVPKSKPVEYRERWHDGEPPHDGWYEIEGHGRRRMYRGSLPRHAWCMSDNGGAGDPLTEEALGHLRWRHAPDGVEVERRVHIKVR